jgi:DNA-binding NarL/FixJ family response regulator
MIIKVGIVDDRPVNRLSVKEKLAAYKEVAVMMEAEDGNSFLNQLKKAIVKPDVVLMDLEMPGLNGIETISMATANYPDIKFIVLTVFEDSNKIFEAIKAGASGYLLKDDSAMQIIDAITNVYEYNGIPMSPSIARKAFELLKKLPVAPEEDTENEITESTALQGGLSKRELDVLSELISGKNYKAIGEKLFISPLTVRRHVKNIYAKLHVNNRAQVINIAHKAKWI